MAEANLVLVGYAFTNPQSSFAFSSSMLNGAATGFNCTTAGDCGDANNQTQAANLTDTQLTLVPDGDQPMTRFSVTIFGSAASFVQDSVDSSVTAETGADPEATIPSGDFVNSAVISARAAGSNGEKFKGTIRFELPALISASRLGARRQLCSFWQFDDGAESGEGSLGAGSWSQQGCRVVEEDSTEEKTVCECNHLTNFAVLTSDPSSLSSTDVAILDTVTYIGLAISIPCLMITVAIFLFFKKTQTMSKLIVLHVSLNLAVALIIFAFGVGHTQDPDLCTAAAVLLHYFLLAAFGWMLIEGYHLYLTFVVVFNTQRQRQMLFYSAIAYSWPLVVVGTTLGVQGPAGYRRDDVCWLREDDGTLWAFIGPVAAVVAVNSLIFAVILKSIRTVGLKITERHRRQQTVKAVRASAMLLSIMGVTWIFGLLAVTGSKAMLYAFVFFNVFQGAFIFVFHCLLDKNVRAVLAGQSFGGSSYRSWTGKSVQPQVARPSKHRHGDKHQVSLEEVFQFTDAGIQGELGV